MKMQSFDLGTNSLGQNTRPKRKHGNGDGSNRRKRNRGKKRRKRGRTEYYKVSHEELRLASLYCSPPPGIDCGLLGAGAVQVAQSRLAQLHLLQDLVGVGPVVQVLLEEVAAPVREHLFHRLVLLVFAK